MRKREARRLGEVSLEAARPHRGWMAHALHLLGDITAHPDQFDAKASEAHHRQALAIAKSCGMRLVVAHCHLGLGKLCWRTGARGQAQEHVATATTMYREMDMPFWLGW